jgi:hypothetical protein
VLQIGAKPCVVGATCVCEDKSVVVGHDRVTIRISLSDPAIDNEPIQDIYQVAVAPNLVAAPYPNGVLFGIGDL